MSYTEIVRARDKKKTPPKIILECLKNILIRDIENSENTGNFDHLKNSVLKNEKPQKWKKHGSETYRRNIYYSKNEKIQNLNRSNNVENIEDIRIKDHCKYFSRNIKNNDKDQKTFQSINFKTTRNEFYKIINVVSSKNIHLWIDKCNDVIKNDWNESYIQVFFDIISTQPLHSEAYSIILHNFEHEKKKKLIELIFTNFL